MKRPTLRDASHALLFVVAILAAAPTPTRADEQLPFAFAYRLGSGVYTAGGRTIQIYRLSFSATILEPKGRDFGLELSLPVTIGFYDFKALDVLDSGLPEQVGAISFTPGLRVPIAVRANWTLTPFAEVGPARESDTDTTTWVYGLGLESLATFSSGPGIFRLNNAFAYVGEDPSDQPGGSLIEVDTGLEYRLPLGWMIGKHEVDFGGYGQSFRYWREEDELRAFFRPATRTLVANWEVGFTFGTVAPWKVLKIPLPRVGIGYRFGEEAASWRLALGSVF